MFYYFIQAAELNPAVPNLEVRPLQMGHKANCVIINRTVKELLIIFREKIRKELSLLWHC